MDLIEDTLADMVDDDKYCPAMRVAINLARKTMHKYYEKTDFSEVYRAAMRE